MTYVKKTITLSENQAKWVEKNFINLSKFVQAKLAELRESKKKEDWSQWAELVDFSFWDNEEDEVWNDAKTY